MHSVCPDLVHMQSEGTRVRRTSTSVAFDSSCLPSAPRVPSPASAQSVQNSSVKTRVSKTIGSADGPTRWRPGRSTPGRSRLSSESHTSAAWWISTVSQLHAKRTRPIASTTERRPQPATRFAETLRRRAAMEIAAA